MGGTNGTYGIWWRKLKDRDQSASLGSGVKTGLGENCERTQAGLTTSLEQQVAGPCEHAKEFSC